MSQRTRISSSTVPWAIRGSVCWRKPRTNALHLRRAAGEHGPRRRDHDLQADVLVERGLEGLERGAAGHDRGAGRRRARARPSASAASACAPHGAWPGQERQQLLRPAAAERSTSSTSAGSGAPSAAPSRPPRRAARPRAPAGPAPRSGPTPGRPRRHRDRLLEVAAHALRRRLRPRGPCRATSRAGSSARPRWRRRGRARREAEPALGLRDVAELEEAERHAAGGQELDRPVALELAARCASSPRESARSGTTLARAHTWTPNSIWSSRRARSLSVTSSDRRLVTRRISSRWRAEDVKWMTGRSCA